ncbi:O-Antigen ligase [compost metagenome]
MICVIYRIILPTKKTLRTWSSLERSYTMLNGLFYTFTGLLGLSFFTSKSAIAISGWLLFLTSLFMVPWAGIWKRSPWLVLTLALYPLAIVINLFSLGGVSSAFHTAGSLAFILFALPFYVLWTNSRLKKLFLLSSFASLIVACAYSFYTLATGYHGVFTGNERITAFFDVSRWGLFSATGILALYIAVFQKSRWWVRLVCFFGLISATVSFIISNSRAPMLGLLASFIFLSLFTDRRYLKGLFIIALGGAITLVASPRLLERVKSIAAVQTAPDGQLISENTSNAGRLYMWKVAGDFWKEQPFLGTGMENTEAPLKKFVSKQSEEYQKRYIIHTFSFRDQHNSYLNVLVQFGLIYFIIFFGVIGWILFKAWDRKKIQSSPERQFAWAGIICFLIVGIFYGEIISYGSIVFWPLIPLLFYEKSESPRTT